MSRTPRAAAIAAALVLALAALVLTHVLTFDHFAGAYGLSFGTNFHYCSIELTTAAHFTCQAAS